MKTRLVKKILVICASLMTLAPVMGDDFKNSVVNMKFTKDSVGNLKVNVVTAKPYTNPVFVNRKEDNRYVILLPETGNAMCGRPVIDNVAGTVSGVTIKTQPYSAGGCKGYTKITITSPHPIKVTAHASVPIGSAPVQVQKPVAKPTQTVAKTTPVQVQKPVAKPTQTVVKTTPVQVQKPVAKPTQTVAKTTPVQAQKHVVKPIQTVAKKTPVQAQKTLVKPAQTVAKTTPVQVQKPVAKPAQTVAKKTPVQAQKPVVKPTQTVEQTKVATKPKVEDDFDTMPQPNILLKEQKQLAEEFNSEKVVSADNKSSNKFSFDFDMIKLLMVISAIGLPILVLMFIISMNRKMRKKLQTVSETVQAEPVEDNQENIVNEVEEDVNLAETQEMLQEENEILSDEVDESFANIINKEEATDTIMSMPLEQKIDEILDDNVHDELSEPEEEAIEESLLQDDEPKEELEEEPFEDDVLDEIELEEVTEDLEYAEDDEPQENLEQVEDEESDSYIDDVEQTTQDDEEGISEVQVEDNELEDDEVLEENETFEQNEDVEEDIDEESEKEEDVSIEEPLISEEADLSEDSVGDVEVVEDDVQNENTEDNISEILDDDIEDDEDTILSDEAVQETDDLSAEDENADEIVEEYIPDGFINEYEPEVDDDSIFEELRADALDFSESELEDDLDNDSVEVDETAQDDEVFDELREEYVTVDGLTVLSKADLTDSSGFYLVNFENFSSLIGYINEEIFVLKTFDVFVNNEIYVKVAEQLSDKIYRYIVKVGLYKMVIEVTDKKMSHLIDL